MESHTHKRSSDTNNPKHNLFEFLNDFEVRHRSFISLIVRPLFMLLIFLSVGYYTMWLSSTYVKQTDFRSWVEKQISQDSKQDELAKTRFEVVQTKLDSLINQQTIYTEQLKSFNQVVSNQQKQMDNLNERITYLERNMSKYRGTSTNNY
jgi:septal ring factor EnvC (AmiA/AmiB activator)